jgi:hypothetical protein
MSGYIYDQILSETELKEARDLASSLEFYQLFQMYNLFDMERADIKGAWLEHGFARKLLQYSKQTDIIGFYFLRYVPGSFTRMHEDHNTKLTIVTLLEENDLVGGHAIVRDKYKQKPRPAEQVCRRADFEDKSPPYGQDIIMDVLPLCTGDSLVYGPDQSHAVSKVYQGSRLVLVAWFNG